jgi:hypothetical protein
LVNVGALVVVAKQNGSFAEARAGCTDAFVAGGVLHLIEFIEADSCGLHCGVLELMPGGCGVQRLE